MSEHEDQGFFEDTVAAAQTAAYGDPTGCAAVLAIAVGVVAGVATAAVHLVAAVVRLGAALVGKASGKIRKTP